MGKAKQSSKGKGKGKGKGGKKVKQDSFLKKEWRHVFVPGFFGKRDIGFTISQKCARGRQPVDYVKDRSFEVSHGDLVNEQSHAFRLFKWRSVDVKGDDILTVFAGMRLSVDKLGSVMRKYRTLIEARCDVKTADDYVLRVFGIAFTKRLNNNRKACYAQQSKRREIRDTMIAVMKELSEKQTIAELCQSWVGETIEKEIIERCKNIFQVENVFVTKVKVLKSPAFTSEALDKIHHGRPAEVPKPAEVARPEETAAPPA
jgi:small subunit ribosomal protein S3Ae